MKRIGLTGGIGCGKSTVAAHWVSRGATLIDTDAIARSVTAPGGSAIAALVEAFGAQVLDASGAMDRDAMRARVFSDTAARARLEGILHPMIGQACEAQAGNAQGVVLFDVPLLVESGRWRQRVDRVLVVDASTQTQVERVMRRSGWSREMVERVIAQQAPRALRRAAADAVIHNEALSLEALDREVGLLWAHWINGR